MLLSSYLDACTIHVETAHKTRFEVYEEMAKRICHNHTLPIDDKEMMDSLIAKDASAPSAYPSGLAIPHLRLEDFNDTVIAITFLQHAIDYEGIAVEWVVLIITDKSSSNLYLNVVATLLKLSQDEQLLQQFKQAKDGHAILNLLKSNQISIKDKLTISDIMNSNPISIHPQATLRELADLMNAHHVAGMPVVASNGCYLGEVDVLNLLKVGIPDYMLMMDHLGFLNTYEPLEQLFKQENTTTVGEILINDGITLLPSASIIEAVFEMIQHKKRYISVVQDSRLLGVITAMEVFHKVFVS